MTHKFNIVCISFKPFLMTDIFSCTKVIAVWKRKAPDVKTEAAFNLPIFSTVFSVRSEASLYEIPYHRFDSLKRLAVHLLQHT